MTTLLASAYYKLCLDMFDDGSGKRLRCAIATEIWRQMILFVHGFDNRLLKTVACINFSDMLQHLNCSQ